MATFKISVSAVLMLFSLQTRFDCFARDIGMETIHASEGSSMSNGLHDSSSTPSPLREFILEKLNLKNIPHAKRKQPPPSYLGTVYEMMEAMSSKEQNAHSKFPKIQGILPDKVHTNEQHGLLDFKLSHKITKENISRIELVLSRHWESPLPKGEGIKVTASHDTFKMTTRANKQKGGPDWDVFDISQILSTTSQDENQHFFTNIKVDIELLPKVLNDGNFFSLENMFEMKNQGSAAPLLVIYTDVPPCYIDSFDSLSKHHSRKTRNIFTENIPIRKDRSNGADEKCQLQKWYLNFEDTILENWIIRPYGYQANVCVGKCMALLTDRQLNATNHSVLKSMYLNAKPDTKNLPHAHCVPIKLSAISIYHYDTDNNPTVQQMPRMVVENCGCN